MTKKNTSKKIYKPYLYDKKKNHNMPRDTHGPIEEDNERSRHKSKYDNNR